MPIVQIFPQGAVAAPAFDGVVAPSPTSDSKASGIALANKTFSAFTDPNGLIDNYQAVTTNADGTCSWSGSGLGPYAPTSADGDSGTLSLNARDVSNNVLATAVHTYDRAAAGGAGSSWTNVSTVDFTASNTGSISPGTVVIGGVTFIATFSAGTLTDTVNGIEARKTGTQFMYFGPDVVPLLTDAEKPFRYCWAVQNMSIPANGNLGLSGYSGSAYPGTIRIPSFQTRINNTSGTYTEQPLYAGGAINASGSFAFAGNTAYGTPSSAVFEAYVRNGRVAVRIYAGTTTIPAATNPDDVFTSTSWRNMELCYGAAASGSNPDVWPNLLAGMALGSGGSSVAIDGDFLTFQLDSWG